VSKYLYALCHKKSSKTFLRSISVVFLTAFDSLYYGRLTFTPIAFLKRNVLESISLFYGQSPVHFYFSSAMPFVCMSTLPFTIHGIHSLLSRASSKAGFDSQARRWYGTQGESDPVALKTTAFVSVLFITSMSLLGHKEVRFLQPIVPLLHIYEGYALSMLPSLQALWSSKATRLEEAAQIRRIAQLDRNAQAGLRDSLSEHRSARNRRHILFSSQSQVTGKLKEACGDIYHRHGKLSALLLGAHILPIIYLSLHSAGQVSVVEAVGYLSRQGQLDQVAFLMPCHSTPWMSHMHDQRLDRDNNSWFISCEPPLNG
jgi:phosphatidylinositol glycan class B